MDILYVMVLLSLSFSFAFLAIFFWAVDSDQLNSLDQTSYLVLEDNENKGNNDES